MPPRRTEGKGSVPPAILRRTTTHINVVGSRLVTRYFIVLARATSCSVDEIGAENARKRGRYDPLPWKQEGWLTRWKTVARVYCCCARVSSSCLPRACVAWMCERVQRKWTLVHARASTFTRSAWFLASKWTPGKRRVFLLLIKDNFLHCGIFRSPRISRSPNIFPRLFNSLSSSDNQM